MAGLVPAIHVFLKDKTSGFGRGFCLIVITFIAPSCMVWIRR
jgi:hypothetical protein